MKQALLRWADSDVGYSFRTSPLAVVAAVVAFGCVFCAMFADLEPDVQRRAKEILHDYPSLLKNTPDNLQKWIANPRAIDPKTAMPQVGVDEAGGGPQLIAYVVPRVAERTATGNELWRFLSEILPWHMLPARFVVLERLPVSPITYGTSEISP